MYLSLRKRSDFKKVFDSGKKSPSRSVVVYVLPNDLPLCRLGLVASRKVGNAVVRNRVRRRIREVVRRLLKEKPLFCDVVIVARSAAVDAVFDSLVRDIRRGLSGFFYEESPNSAHKTL